MNTEKKKWLKFRISTLLAFVLVLFVALFSRAFQLQILSAEQLNSIARRQHTQTLKLQPDRGIILDRMGEKLAATVMADSVCADPSKVKYVPETAERLSKILSIDRKLIVRRLSSEKNFCFLSRKISPEQAKSVNDLKIDGIFTVKEPMRFYPGGELAGHLVGFTGTDAQGLGGLEQQYEKYLRGVPQKLTWTRDAKGQKLYPHAESAEIVPIEGTGANGVHNYSLVLTIDKRIQHIVESHLKNAVIDKGAKGGFAIVMDPRTGEIVALANETSFDPNKFKEINPEVRKNKAIADANDPGSTFKPFLVAAAFEEKIVKENDMFFCENGNYAVANRVIHEANHKRHGMLSVHDIIKYSSNIGSAKIGEKLGREKFYSYIQKFGFGEKTGIDLPGEAKGILRPVEQWNRVDATTIAFGQGISVTGIQLVTALSCIANKGVLMKPYIVRAMMNRNGEIVQSYHPTEVRRVIAPETAKRITAIMTDVVGMEDGTGKNARIANISVAGKTGTAQKYDAAAHAYSSLKVRTSFMGFFPAENPQIAMLVVLDEPQRDRWGGVASAPVFKNIGEQLLTCFKTDIKRNPDPEIELNPSENRNPLKFVSAPAPLAVTPEPEPDETAMPSFKGLTIREALRKSRERGIDIRIVGSGWAVAQNPAPGMPLPRDGICTVTFKAGS
jgi:cell division protein FtsI (penicillin-binding protein 3)